MEDLLGKWCVVTGAASGIGKATAQSLHAEGARLILCDVQNEKVDQVAADLRSAGAEVLSYGVDVALFPQMERFFDRVKEQVGAVDVLINNAGILKLGGFDESSIEDWHQIMDVNFWGALHAVKLFVPEMIERGGGAVVNVASASGIVGFSRLTAYSASKFALVGLSEALRGELGGTGVRVSTICPGLVRTSIVENAQLSLDQRAYAQDVLERKGIAPEQVAQAIVRALAHGTPVVHVGKDAKALSWAARLFPSHASEWLASWSKRD